MDKSFRIHTEIGKDTLLNVELQQDMDFMEVLSLRLRQKDAYKLHSSNYGVVVGRVLANDAFGIPNVKVSVFIKVDSDETVDNKNVYPYTNVTSLDDNNIRYNLLPDESNEDCYRIVGTFPNKTEVLDEDTKLEIYDKYWKYTTVTNKAGDYMLFGVPVGNQQIHVDLDLSDIGILSQKPRDMLSKGYTMSDFDSANQFKSSTNLGNLVQIISQDTSVYVYPFWGDTDNGVIGITRSDVQVNYKFEPTCVFLGSLVSDNGTNAIGHECSPQKKNGRNAQLIAGEGTIEMIRKTTDGLVEEYQIEGNRLIDDNGTWCYQIPMNLDYVGTDEYGNICPTEDPSKGIPTRTRVRFRISKDDSGDEGFSRHTAKILVPNNPTLIPDSQDPKVKVGSEVEKSYTFGSSTPDEHFRDLYWNNVYSIKSYIPRFQTSNRQNTEYYSGIKSVNVTEDQNVVPFNKLNVKLPFMFVIVCILFKILLTFIEMFNEIINVLYDTLLCPHLGVRIPWPINKEISIGHIWCIKIIPCVSFNTGLDDTDNVMYLPGCDCPNGGGCLAADCNEEGCTKSSDTGELKDKVEQKLALSYNIVHLDLYNDWVNGTVYLPLWYWRVRKKKTFLFGLFSLKAKNDYCKCDKDSGYKHIHFLTACDLGLNDSYDYTDGHSGKKYHADKEHVEKATTYKGVIKPVENKDDLTVYYYASMLPSNKNANSKYKDFSDYTGETYVIRAFATDIILLGSLNENNSMGLPQLFNSLPSTTANVPEIATIERSNSSSDDEDPSEEESAAMSNEDTGTGIITGMDWQRKGDKKSPKYGMGLFMDLGCTQISTKPKSCINASRLCELNVSMDMNYSMSYATDKTIKTGIITTDGMISKTEIETNEGRAMFATMNHLGFLPTNVAEDKLGIITQIPDPITNYYVNKFQFIYPTDFDGRLNEEALDYTNTGQKTFDHKDEAYLRYRFGYGAYKFYNNNGDGNQKHRFPLYNNSFYFFFGIKAGNTALDRFYKTYNAACVSNNKHPFTFELLTREKKTCPKDDKGYSFVYASMSDIQTPYSYKLYDSKGNILIEEDNIYATFLTLGTSEETSALTLNSESDGKLYYHDKSTGYPTGEAKGDLDNGNYTLTITDGNGNTLTERFTLEINRIKLSYLTKDLTKKYYDHFTEQPDLCNDKHYHGQIILSAITIDGEDQLITSVCEGGTSTLGDNSKSYLINDNIAQVEIKTLAAEDSLTNEDSTIGISIDNCICQNNHQIEKSEYSDYENAIGIFAPGSYLLQITQLCNGEIKLENSTNEIVTINNFEPFNMYINDVPVKFLIGNRNESDDEDKTGFDSISNIDDPTKLNENFHSTSHIGNIPVGWLNPYNEDMYVFAPTTKRYESIWEDFLDVEDLNMNNIASKLSAIAFKFNCLFKLSKGVYVTTQDQNTLRASYTGGVSPVLLRCLRPNYEDQDKVTTIVQFGSMSTVTCDEHHPNIVTWNYSCEVNGCTEGLHPNYLWGYTILPTHFGVPDDNEVHTYFNNDYALHAGEDHTALGNYFAAFTNNGGITSTIGHSLKNTTEFDSIPVFANPYTGVSLSTISKVGNYGVGTYDDVFTAKSPYYPYVKGLFVDRRLDYNYLIIGANISKTIYTKVASPVAIGIRLSGTTFNGIKMAYDETDGYRVIGSSSEGLEYTYTIENGIGKTVWNSGGDKLYYSSTFNGMDIKRSYTSHGTFMAEAYPQKNTINISGSPLPYANFETKGCSYDMKASLNMSNLKEDSTDIDGLIKALTTEGESISFSVDYSDIIKLTEVDAGTGDNYNAYMELPEGGGHKFSTNEVDITCKMLSIDGGDSYVGTKIPALYNVTDGNLTNLKTTPSVTTINEDHVSVGGSYATGEDDIYSGDYVNPAFTIMHPIELPSNVDPDYEKSGFFIKNDEVLTDADTDFERIVLHKHLKKIPNSVEAITIVTDKYFRNMAGDYLLKHLRLINTSDFYDIRPLEVEFGGSGFGIDIGSYCSSAETYFTDFGGSGSIPVSGTDLDGVMKEIGTTEGVFSVLKEADKSQSALTSLNESTDPTTKEKEYSASGESFTTEQMGHTQYFVLKIGTKTNEAFVNYNNCQFRFIFTVNGRVVTVTDAKVVHSDSSAVYLLIQWPSQAGAYDTLPEDMDKTDVQVYAKASNGFVYKLTFAFKGHDPNTWKQTSSQL